MQQQVNQKKCNHQAPGNKKKTKKIVKVTNSKYKYYKLKNSERVS